MLISRWFLRAARISLAAACLFVLAGCEEDVLFKPDFSVNLLEPGPKWPKKKKNLTAHQQEIFDKYGRPDHLRIQWNPEGRIMVREQLKVALKDKKPQTLPPCSWVYTRRNMEVVFDPEGPREVPITDEIRLVLRHGDPEDVKPLPGGVSQWSFYGAGRMYRMVSGRIVEEKEFPAMGSFRK